MSPVCWRIVERDEKADEGSPWKRVAHLVPHPGHEPIPGEPFAIWTRGTDERAKHPGLPPALTVHVCDHCGLLYAEPVEAPGLDAADTDPEDPK